MEKCEFFQDAEGLWRWRCTLTDGNRVMKSMRSHPSRAHAVADAKDRGYTEGDPELDSSATFVRLRVLREE